MKDVSALDDHRAEVVLATIRSRRVTRDFSDQPVSVEAIHLVIEAGRWATSAGNRHINKFLVIRDPATIRLVKSVSPGMASPMAIIVILVDLEKAKEWQVQVESDPNVYFDVGTQAMNMMLAAHALGLGSCPATSFSRSGVGEVLELPSTLIPQFIVQLGYPEPDQQRLSAGTQIRPEDLVFWERPGNTSPLA